jgi:hypothetical protein
MVIAPYVVLDQNAFRRPALLGPAIQRATSLGAKLLITEAAVIEMMKNPQWELTAERSLAGLAHSANLVALGRGVPDLMREEVATGRPAYGTLEDFERTPAVQDLIRELSTGNPGPVLAYVRSTIITAQATVLDTQYLDHAQNKQRLIRHRDEWATLLESEPDLRKKLRGDASLRAQLLAHPKVSVHVERGLIAAGMSDTDARRLAYDRSVSSHSLLAMSALALRWYLNGGLDGAKPAKITNDLMDREYITIASLCLELVSEEAKVNELIGEVKDAADKRTQLISAA